MVSQNYWEVVNKRTRSTSRLQNTFFASPTQRIFHGITDRFFFADREKKVLEIGCAPGHKLVDFARRYGYQPYGVEYTVVGVLSSQETLARHHFPTENIFLNDVFNVDFQRVHQDTFDVVISFGFIEYFKNPAYALAAHTRVLKSGGLLLIMIPNISGMYRLLLRFFYPYLLRIHNLSLMSIAVFQNLFKPCAVEKLFCGYYGLVNFGMLQAEGRVRKRLLNGLLRLQSLFNPFLSLLPASFFENRFTSPYLLFIGRKK